MKISKKILLLAGSIVFAAASVFALDLPVKKVKGVEYYYYKAKKGESIYGLSKKLGLSRDEIVRHNPSAADGLKKNMMLFFPVSEYATHTMPDEETEEIVEVVEEIVPEIVKEPTIAVMLPFGLDNKEPDRNNKLALDFYKGLLIAADSLSSRQGQTIQIRAIDLPNTPDGVRNIVAADSTLARAAVIIGPEDITLLNELNAAAPALGTYVLNVLNFRDSAYISNPYSLQANIPQREMYAEAVKGLREQFEGYQPVILKSATGRNDKEAFVAFMAEQYRADGIEPIEINYQNNLLNADLEVLPVDAGQKYVVIPSGGSLADFNKFAYVLKAFRDRIAAMEPEDPTAERAELSVFGYPDWTAFRGDAQDLLHRLEVTVYSRFFDDFIGFSAKIIASDFKRWYGTTMIESLPSYGLLGFDTGTYLIKNLRSNNGTFNPEVPSVFSGIQSTFQFKRNGEGGYYNSALYIIRYLPGGRMSAQVL